MHVKKIERLIWRLQKDGWKIPFKYKYERIYLSPAERVAGVWRWKITDKDGFKMGSPYRVEALLEAENIVKGPFNSLLIDSDG